MTSPVHRVPPPFGVTYDILEPIDAPYGGIDFSAGNTAGDRRSQFEEEFWERISANASAPFQNDFPPTSASSNPELTLQAETLLQPPPEGLEEPCSVTPHVMEPMTATAQRQLTAVEQTIKRPSTPTTDIVETTTAMSLQTPQVFTNTVQPPSSPPLSDPPSPSDEMDLVQFPMSPPFSNSPPAHSSPSSSLFSEHDMSIAGLPIDCEREGSSDHGLLRFKPTPAQWTEFPAILSLARRLGAETDGCFKIVLPTELQDPLPDKTPQKVPANAYKVRQIRQRMFWRVSTVGTEGIFSPSEDDADVSKPAEQAIKQLKTLFNKNKDRQMKNVRYRVDVPAWTAKQRREAGVPERSPIHPLKGDQLNCTKAVIPGIHTPYVYESAPFFGATFQLHAEDFRLYSLNHLYKGRKIWIVIPTTAVDIAEKAFNRKNKCSQFMRHRAEFFFPDRLEKMGIPFRIVDQRPAETIVILPDAYHEGFSTGYTIAEAKNYADPEWTAETYQPCQVSCQLATAIPAEFMRPLNEDETRIDLCAGYDDEAAPLQQQPASTQPQPEEPMRPQSAPKRSHDEQEADVSEGREAKQAKMH
ncbi:Lysine-specific demethylase 4D [Cladobotryum mycophilum]|uniref:Lysine-specific demethylase 4D n=1 Tax=Cladobotryum mycophilum TaxID=491253 RepID=A0ABR0SLU9_9HYPO